MITGSLLVSLTSTHVTNSKDMEITYRVEKIFCAPPKTVLGKP